MALLAFLTALVLALALTPLARRVAFRLGAVDRPNSRKIHTQPVPLLGGAAIFAAAAGTVVWLPGPTREALAVLGGGVLFLGIGFLDDLTDIGAGKLLVEFVAAWLVVALTGHAFHLPWPWAGTLLTVLWIVGVVNAFNCLDCADGVAASAGAVAGGALLAVALLTGQRLEAVLSAAVAGACLGFLAFNLPPARIFLGDAGSKVLGYLVAMVGVMLSPGILSLPAMATPAVVLAIPIVDIIFVHVMRFRTGHRSLRALLTSTGKDHLPHRLLDRGLSPRAVVAAVLVGSLITGAAGVALAAVNTLPGALLIGFAVLGALALLEREWVGAGSRARRLAPQWQPRNLEGP